MIPTVPIADVSGITMVEPEDSASRAEFEAWCRVRWGGDRNALTIREDGEYQNGHVQFAWCAWQRSRAEPAKGE